MAQTLIFTKTFLLLRRFTVALMIFRTTQCFLKDSFSVLHLNIRSINKNFGSFKEFYFYSTLTSNLALFVFQKHGLTTYLSAKIQIFNFQVIWSRLSQSLVSLYNMIHLTNKPTRVTRHSANAIDHIITNSVKGHNDFRSVIVKTDLSDDFLIVFAIKTNETT